MIFANQIKPRGAIGSGKFYIFINPQSSQVNDYSSGATFLNWTATFPLIINSVMRAIPVSFFDRPTSIELPSSVFGIFTVNDTAGISKINIGDVVKFVLKPLEYYVYECTT